MIQNSRRYRSSDVDRMSTLPDDLLNQILSRLPIKEAVATSILSKRWRCVYMLISDLEFDASPLYELLDRPELIIRFTSFVKAVLKGRQFNSLTRFCVKINKIDLFSSRYQAKKNSPDLQQSTIKTWISLPLAFGVRELDLCFFVKNQEIQIPCQVWFSGVLQVLMLHMNLDSGNPESFYLPNLKVCHLKSMNIPEPSFVDRLLSGCPSLEDFALDDCYCTEMMKVINISHPFLRRLRLYVHTVWSIPGGIHNYIRTRVVLNTPNLRYFNYTDQLSIQYSIEHMNALDEAKIYMGETAGDFQSMISLLRPLNNVAHLIMFYSWLHLELENKLPVFRNLKHLELRYVEERGAWHKVLLEFLYCSPSLETLTYNLSYYENDDDDDDDSYQEPADKWWMGMNQDVPCCLTSHLRRVQIGGSATTGAKLKIAKYFLQNAAVLRELVVKGAPGNERVLMKSALENFPRASQNCSIEEKEWDDEE